MPAYRGIYGKLPARGDFVLHGLPASFVTPLDEWLQHRMIGARETLGDDRWLQHYLLSRIWNFCLPAGAVDEHHWLGVLMPSVDRVNRYFPLLAAVTVAEPLNPVAVATANGRWFTGTAELLLGALEDEEQDPQVLLARLGEAELLPPAPELTLESRDQHLLITRPSNSTEASLDALLAGFYPDLSRTGATLWWAQAGASTPASLLTVPGLPGAMDYLLMLDAKEPQTLMSVQGKARSPAPDLEPGRNGVDDFLA